MSNERLTIAAEPRTIKGKQVKILRRDGLIPAVIYGQSDPVTIQLERKALRRVLKQAGSTQLVEVELGGSAYTVLAREIQQHVTRGDLIHVDFYEVDMKATITAEAALILVGESKPVQDGLGSVTLSVLSVEIECLPGDLISEIEVPIEAIETPDDVIYVSDLSIPQGINVLTDPEMAVARFQYTQTEEAAEAEEEEFASVEDVEVIEKGKEEGEEEAEE